MIMKGQVMPAYEAMANDELQSNAADTNETTAKQQGSQQKAFGSVDLWNRQRQMKKASGFLRRWELS
jgi:hypothetical protein